MNIIEATKAAQDGKTISRNFCANPDWKINYQNGYLFFLQGDQYTPDVCDILANDWEVIQKPMPFAEAVICSQKGKLVKSFSLGLVLISGRKRTIVCRHQEGDSYENLASRYVKLTLEAMHACDWVDLGERPNAKKESRNVPLPINKPTPQRRKPPRTGLNFDNTEGGAT